MADQFRICEKCSFSLSLEDKFCPMCNAPAKETKSRIAPLIYAARTRPGILILMGLLAGILVIASAVYAYPYLMDWNQKGEEALDKSDFQSSIENFNKALEIDSSSEAALIGLGDTYFKLIQSEGDNYALPLNYYRRANDLSEIGGSESALKGMGRIYLANKKFDRAQMQFQDIIDQDKKDPLIQSIAYYYLGEALMGQNNISEAIKSFNKSIERSIGNDDSREWNQMALASMAEAYMKDNNTNEAEKYYRKALEPGTECDNCKRACYELINIYRNADRTEETRKYEEICGLTRSI